MRNLNINKIITFYKPEGGRKFVTSVAWDAENVRRSDLVNLHDANVWGHHSRDNTLEPTSRTSPWTQLQSFCRLRSAEGH